MTFLKLVVYIRPCPVPLLFDQGVDCHVLPLHRFQYIRIFELSLSISFCLISGRLSLFCSRGRLIFIALADAECVNRYSDSVHVAADVMSLSSHVSNC